MPDRFLPKVSAEQLKQVQESNDLGAYYDLLAQPLHEELYKRQDFSFFEELSEGQQMLICYDYIQNHVLQGGFIQLIQNGYVNMLVPMPQWLTTAGAEQMALLIDESLKLYVKHRDVLDKETSVEEFSKLYDQLPEFRPLDERFTNLHEPTIQKMLLFATHHIHEFADVAE